MAFTLPVTRTLKTFEENLEANYRAQRHLKDKASFFGFGLWFGETKNAERLKDIQFIKKMVSSVDYYKFRYSTLDKDFRDKIYASDTSLFLRRVIAGSMIFALHRINQTYHYEERVKNGSVLAELIMNLFGIDKFSDIPSETLAEAYDALSKYLSVIGKQPAFSDSFYPEADNQSLMQAIQQAKEGQSITLSTTKIKEICEADVPNAAIATP